MTVFNPVIFRPESIPTFRRDSDQSRCFLGQVDPTGWAKCPRLLRKGTDSGALLARELWVEGLSETGAQPSVTCAPTGFVFNASVWEQRGFKAASASGEHEDADGPRALTGPQLGALSPPDGARGAVW